MAKKHGTGPRILPGMQGYQGFSLVLLAPSLAGLLVSLRICL
jgi:hypothetical protein